MIWFLVLSFVAVVVATKVGAAANPSTIGTDIVQTIYGLIMGLDFGTYRRFQGVPFAHPPLGSLRFRNPVPPGTWSNVLDCRNFTIGCAQTAHGLDVPTNTSEDCLYLELWAPPRGKYASPANVMIFYHGGDFKEGGESFKLYDGSYMASTTNTILVVSNYRLGVLGFLYTTYNDANVGIQDQRFALQWINQNIANFGGNPNSVTIFGESAGGESVLLHFSEPTNPAAQLFHRGIVESGPILDFKLPPPAIELADSFVGLLGCMMGDLSCLQAPNISTILKAGNDALVIPLSIGQAVMKWSPVVDNATVHSEPLTAFQQGKIVNKPLMIGSNLNDGVLFAFAIAGGNKGTLIAVEYIGIVAGIFQDDWILDILLRYPPVWSGDNRYVLASLLTDFLFTCTSRALLRYAETAGISQTYQYQFVRQPPFAVWPPSQEYCNHYVCHGDELPYVFRDTGNPFPWNMTSIDLWTANATSAFWTSFAANSNPGAPWPQYRQSSDESIALNWPLKVVTNLKKDECDFFDKVGYMHPKKPIIETAKRIVAEMRAKSSK